MQNRTASVRALLAVAIVMPACTQDSSEEQRSQPAASPAETRQVAGTAVHFFTTAIVHGQTPTETGKIQRSTDIVQLSGDLQGYVLYQPTSVFDFSAGTLVNTGRQYFSGTVLGGEPTIMYDDAFRFDVSFAASTEHGSVHFRRSQDARGGTWYECDLDIRGTGRKTPAGDGLVDYTGECRRHGPAADERLSK